jgi:putative tricarboxylic transport membrane protein
LLKVTIKSVEIGVAALLLALGALIFYKSIELGPGWGFSGPEPGFFPLAMTILIIVGCVLVLIVTFRQPAGDTFFEVSQEVVDLLKVGVPILLAVILLRWLGMYLTSGIYLGLFMIFYGKYKWWNGAAAGVIFLAILWLILNEAFNLSMPKSVFYPELLPF